MISNRCARKSLVTNCNSIISKNYLRLLVDSNDLQIIFTITIYYNRRICYRDFTSDSCNMNMIQLVTAYSIHY